MGHGVNGNKFSHVLMNKGHGFSRATSLPLMRAKESA
jgi:hypothetical protein